MKQPWMVVLVIVVAVGAYSLGQRSGEQQSSVSSYGYSSPTTGWSPSSSFSSRIHDDDDEKEELRRKLEEARDKAEDVVQAAEDAEDSARMRWLQTGSAGDLIRYQNAEDAADKARDARDALD